MLYFVSPTYAKKWGSKIFFTCSACEIVPPPSNPWLRLYQNETLKVKFVYNRLTGENGGRLNQITHHLQKSTHRACDSIIHRRVVEYHGIPSDGIIVGDFLLPPIII